MLVAQAMNIRKDLTYVRFFAAKCLSCEIESGHGEGMESDKNGEMNEINH
jgi:hypothetical protein